MNNYIRIASDKVIYLKITLFEYMFLKETLFQTEDKELNLFYKFKYSKFSLGLLETNLQFFYKEEGTGRGRKESIEPTKT